MRVHLPHTRSLGKRHCDRDYYHQPNEINVWIPLVERVSGTNSLYCESSPVRFRPRAACGVRQGREREWR